MNTLKKSAARTTRQSFHWSQQGKRTIGRPKNIEKIFKDRKMTWEGHGGGGLQEPAADRQAWHEQQTGLV